jgi:hypothetical protein
MQTETWVITYKDGAIYRGDISFASEVSAWIYIHRLDDNRLVPKRIWTENVKVDIKP